MEKNICQNRVVQKRRLRGGKKNSSIWNICCEWEIVFCLLIECKTRHNGLKLEQRRSSLVAIETFSVPQNGEAKEWSNWECCEIAVSF